MRKQWTTTCALLTTALLLGTVAQAEDIIVSIESEGIEPGMSFDVESTSDLQNSFNTVNYEEPVRCGFNKRAALSPQASYVTGFRTIRPFVQLGRAQVKSLDERSIHGPEAV